MRGWLDWDDDGNYTGSDPLFSPYDWFPSFKAANIRFKRPYRGTVVTVWGDSMDNMCGQWHMKRGGSEYGCAFRGGALSDIDATINSHIDRFLAEMEAE